MRKLLLRTLLAAAFLLAGKASAATIAYDISSLGDMGLSPFSGIFKRAADDDGDDDDGGDGKQQDAGKHGDVQVLSDDLSGLIRFSTDDRVLFLDGQELAVEEFSLMGTASLCGDCRELAISIELDPDFASVLEVQGGTLEGEIHLQLRLDGFERPRPIALRVSGETSDPEWNTATPDFLSLLLELDFPEDGLGHRVRDPEDGDWGKRWKDEGDDDWDERRRDEGDDDGEDHRVFLKAQGPVVPEPGTVLLLGVGLVGLGLLGRR